MCPSFPLASGVGFKADLLDCCQQLTYRKEGSLVPACLFPPGITSLLPVAHAC